MALPKKSSYRFTNVSAFEDGKTLLGDASVFPNRPANERAVLRAEDYLYLIEGLREREWVKTVPPPYQFNFHIPAKDSVLPLLSAARFDLEDRDAAQRIRDYIKQLLGNPVGKFNEYGFAPATMISAKVDEVFPVRNNTMKNPTAVKFSSAAEMNAAVRSCIESAASYPESRLPITVEEMTRMYNDLARMNRVMRIIPGDTRIGTIYEVSCSINRTTGEENFNRDSYQSSFSGEFELLHAGMVKAARDQATVRIADMSTYPYMDGEDARANCVVWLMAKATGYGPTGEFFGYDDGAYFIERVACRDSNFEPIEFNQIKTDILKAVGFSSMSNDAIARACAKAPLPTSAEEGGSLSVMVKVLGAELLTGDMKEGSTTRQSYFRAAIPPLVTYGSYY